MAARGESGSGPGDAQRDRVLGAAGSFTGLWALTWLGSSAFGAGATVQGAFAVGGVMGASGLTVLWWKTRALRTFGKRSAEAEAAAEGPEPPDAMPSRTT